MFRGQRGEDSQSLRTQRNPQGTWQKDGVKKPRLNFSPSGGGTPRKADDRGDPDNEGEAPGEGHPPSQLPGGFPADHDQGDQAHPQGQNRGWRGGKGFRRGFGKGRGKGKYKGKGKGKKRW